MVAWFLLCCVPQECVTRDCVAVVEFNHVYDEHGKERLVQVVFWDRCGSDRVCVDWRMWRLKLRPRLTPRGWLLRWHDSGVLREVSAVSWEETHTQFDPEIAARDTLPQERRRKLK